ncbi:type VII secretion target [Aldersonia kunmingensis]|uniref:type VII secretion target n=1 Tax=Aldersonia kunmingensis TaxID=408066 RepID=UPI00082F67A7|nr:type VII secretion target [Aldersonia kunmingensis]
MLDDAQNGLKSLQDAVGSGALRVDHGAAERVAQHLDVLAESVKRQAAEMGRAGSTHSGFGTFDSGAQLHDGFEAKMLAAVNQLDAYATVVTNMSAAVRQAGTAYSDQDHANQGAINTAEDGLS